MAHAYYYRDTSILAAAVHLPPGISPGGVEKSLGFGLSEHERRGTIEIPCPSSSAEGSIWIWIPRYGYIERYTMANDYSNPVRSDYSALIGFRDDLLLELAELLERAWIHPCGTSACVLGHWAAVHPERGWRLQGRRRAR